MKQFKLTDVEGKEFILSIPEHKSIDEAWDKARIEAVTPEPEIKVGMWAAYEAGMPQKKYLFYITKIDGHKVWGIEYPGSEDYCCDLDDVVSVTPAEIEAHLKKVCEKYVGKHITGLVNQWAGVITTEDATIPYVENFDRYWMRASDGINVCVYEKGKFAEILPDKKKRPETREEFGKFVEDWLIEREYGASWPDFLNQYEL